MRELVLVATLMAGAMAGPSTVAAQAQPQPQQQQQPQEGVCADALARLDQEVDALDGGAAPQPGLTRDELAELDNLQTTARRLAEAADGRSCERVVRQGVGLVGAIHMPRVVTADGLKDMALQSAEGEEVGTIREVVIDPRSGRVAYAVVELGGFLGLGERYFPVPWAVFETGARGDGLVLNVPRDRLVTAPQFGRDQRPDMADRRWALALHTYYGVEPYWLEGGAALAGQVERVGRSSEAVARLEREVQRLSQGVEGLSRKIEETLPADDAPEAVLPPLPGDAPGAPATQ